MPSLYRIRAVIHSIHDSFVEIRGGLSYHLRSRHHTAFVALIIPPSSPFSYHLRSTKIFQTPANQSIPKFPSFPAFPCFPRFPAFPAFPRFPQKFTHPIPQKSSVLLFFCLFSPFVLLSKKEPRTARLGVPVPLWDKNQSALCERTIGTKQKTMYKRIRGWWDGGGRG